MCDADAGLHFFAQPKGFGNLRRNALTGPGFADSDISLEKTTRIAETAALVLRVDAFDLLNHANFANPNLTASGATTSTFGQITATRTAVGDAGSSRTTAVCNALRILTVRPSVQSIQRPPLWWPLYFVMRPPRGRPSDPHGHDDVAVFVFVVGGIFGAHLAGGLRVFEFEADFAGVADGLEEVEHVGGVEADDEGVEVVGGFDGVFGFAGFGGGAGDLQLVLLQANLDGAGALVGELGDALDGAERSSQRTMTDLLLSRGSTAS